MKMKKILKKVARVNGITVKEVETEIQAAINEAWKNPPDDAAAAYQRKVPCMGEIPTPDEFIRFMVSELQLFPQKDGRQNAEILKQEADILKKIKYPRVEKKDRTPYVTGDAQDWTYQYTWEDLEESFNDSSTDIHAMGNIVFKKVRAYFKDHPEEALSGGRFREGWTVEEIKKLCENSICC